MGQKVNPIAFRLGINKTWRSRWFNPKEMPQLIKEDDRIRKFIRGRVENAGISRVDIERMGENIRVTIHTDRPGVIIGKGGAEVEAIKDEIEEMTGKRSLVNIKHIKNPQTDAYIIANSIASALEKKMRFRSVIKRAVYNIV